MNVLFVYGTLAPGERNAHLMDEIVGTWQNASVRGQYFIKSWGFHKNAPGFYPDPEGSVVSGQVFTSPDLSDHWERLDAFEGPDYQRVEIEATLDTGESIRAYIYRTIPRD